MQIIFCLRAGEYNLSPKTKGSYKNLSSLSVGCSRPPLSLGLFLFVEGFPSGEQQKGRFIKSGGELFWPFIFSQGRFLWEMRVSRPVERKIGDLCP